MSDTIAEVIVNKDIEISQEMVEEYEAFLADIFHHDFGLLINKVHHYCFAFEVKLSIGSHVNLKAIAVVNYNKKSELITEDVAKARKMDGWRFKIFFWLRLRLAART